MAEAKGTVKEKEWYLNMQYLLFTLLLESFYMLSMISIASLFINYILAPVKYNGAAISYSVFFSCLGP